MITSYYEQEDFVLQFEARGINALEEINRVFGKIDAIQAELVKRTKEQVGAQVKLLETYKIVTKAGKTYIATIDAGTTKEGKFRKTKKTLTEQIEKQAAAQNKLNQTNAKAAKNASLAAGYIASNLRAGGTIDPTKSTPANIVGETTALKNLQAAIQKTKLGYAEVQGVLNKITKGSLVELTGRQQIVAKAALEYLSAIKKLGIEGPAAFNKIQIAAKQTALAAEQAADKFLKGFTKETQLTTNPRKLFAQKNLNYSDTIRLAQAHEELRQKVIKLAYSYEQLNAVYAKVKAGQISTLKGSDLEIAKSIENIGHLQTKMGVSGTKSFQRIANEGEKSARKMHLAWSNFASFFLTHLVYTAFFRFTQAVRSGVEETIELQKRISEIRTISQTVQVDFNNLAEGIRKVSNELGYSVQDIAEGVYESVSNQLGQAQEALLFIERAGKFARATNSSVEDSVNLLSSALNAYNQNVGLTEYNAQQLFRLIDLGRVRADEISDTLGRVAVIGGQVGVSLAEISAALSEITIKGIPAKEGMTQLYNVLQAVLKPTEAMTEVFNKLGYATPELALRMLGLTGILKELEKASNGSSTEFAAFFGRVRALRGGLSLTGQSMARFEKTLAKMTEKAKEYYDEAVKISFESEAVEFEKNWTRIKNFFIIDFGPPVLKVLNAALEKAKQLKDPYGFEAEKYLKSNEADEQKINTRLDKYLRAVDVLFQRRREAIKIGYIDTIQFNKRQADDAIRNLIETTRASINTLQDTIAFTENKLEGFKNLTESIKKETDEVANIRLEQDLTVSARTGDADDRIEKSFKDRIKIIRQAADAEFSAAISSINTKNFDEATRQIEKASSLYSKLGSEKETIRDRNAEIIKQISELEAELTEKLSKATTYEKNKLRDSYSTRIGLLQSEYRQNEDALKNLRGLENQRIERLEKIKKAKDEAIKAEGVETDEDYVKKLTERIDDLNNELEITRRKFSEILDKVRDFGKTQNIDDFEKFIDGILGLLDGLGEADEQTYLERFREDINKTIDVLNQFKEANERAAKQVKEEKIDETALKNTLGINADSIKDINKFLKEALAQQGIFVDRFRDVYSDTKAPQEILNFLEATKDSQSLTKGDLDRIRELANTAQEKIIDESLRTIVGKSLFERHPVLSTAASIASIVSKPIPLAYTLPGILKEKPNTNVIGKADAKKLYDDIERTVALIVEYRLALDKAKLSGEQFNSLTEKGGFYLDNILKELRGEEIDKGYEFFSSVEETISAVKDTNIFDPKNLEDTAAGIVGIDIYARTNLLPTFNSVGEGFANDMYDAYIYASNIVSVLNSLNTFKSTSTVVPPPVEEKFSGGRLKYLAYGGRGTDTVPAMLSPGEFVMTRTATRRFYQQLVSMNAGGRATTASNPSQNFGDINVSIQTNSVDSRSARDLARQISQEIKRGTVKI